MKNCFMSPSIVHFLTKRGEHWSFDQLECWKGKAIKQNNYSHSVYPASYCAYLLNQPKAWAITAFFTHWTHYLFSDWLKAYGEISASGEISVVTADYAIIMSRTLKVTGSHVRKIIIRFGFCDIQNNQGLGKGYQPQSSALADNPYVELDYSG